MVHLMYFHTLYKGNLNQLIWYSQYTVISKFWQRLGFKTPMKSEKKLKIVLPPHHRIKNVFYF